MAGRSKAAYSERKQLKSTFTMTVNCHTHPPIQGKENRLPPRPINSAIGTGGLDFLIAHALLVLCHSLFKVVIEPVFYSGKIVVDAIGISGIKTIVDGDKAHPVLRKSEVGI